MTAGPSTSKPTTTVFLAGLVLMTMVLSITTGNARALAIEFKQGRLVINRAIGEPTSSKSSTNPS